MKVIIKKVGYASVIGLFSSFTTACVQAPDSGSDTVKSSTYSTPEGRAAVARSIESAPCQPTEMEIEMLELVNKARAEGQKCGAEQYPPVGALTWNCKLAEAAKNHNEDMVKFNFFAHEGSDGLKAGSRIDAVGYNWRAYGENLAGGMIEPAEAMSELLASPGHCKNIMGAQFAEFGTSSIFYTNAEYAHYWTQIYGTEL